MEGEGVMETAVQVRVMAATEGPGRGSGAAPSWWPAGGGGGGGGDPGGGGGGGIAPAAPGWSGGGGRDASFRAGAVVSAGKEFRTGLTLLKLNLYKCLALFTILILHYRVHEPF